MKNISTTLPGALDLSESLPQTLIYDTQTPIGGTQTPTTAAKIVKTDAMSEVAATPSVVNKRTENEESAAQSATSDEEKK